MAKLAPERESTLRSRWVGLREQAREQLAHGDGSTADAFGLARLVRYTFGDMHHTSWTDLGIDVRRRPLGHSGMLGPKEWPISVLVNQAESPRRQRFTVAHELGHYLLRETSGLVAASSVENFCDAFASELLVPQAQLQQLLAGIEGLPVAEELVELANRLRVNFAPLIVKVPSLRTRMPSFALVAWRSPERGYIVDTAAGTGGIGGPPNDRTLAALASWGRRVDDSTDIRMSGVDFVDTRFVLPTPLAQRSRHPPGDPRSGAMAGPVRWTSFRLRNGYLLLTAYFVGQPTVRYSARKASVIVQDVPGAEAPGS